MCMKFRFQLPDVNQLYLAAVDVIKPGTNRTTMAENVSIFQHHLLEVLSVTFISTGGPQRSCRATNFGN